MSGAPAGRLPVTEEVLVEFERTTSRVKVSVVAFADGRRGVSFGFIGFRRATPKWLFVTLSFDEARVAVEALAHVLYAEEGQP